MVIGQHPDGRVDDSALPGVLRSNGSGSLPRLSSLPQGDQAYGAIARPVRAVEQGFQGPEGVGVLSTKSILENKRHAR